jgi:hypothetical protein
VLRTGKCSAVRPGLQAAFAAAMMVVMEQGRISRVRSSRLLWLGACVLCVLFWAAVLYLLLFR